MNFSCEVHSCKVFCCCWYSNILWARQMLGSAEKKLRVGKFFNLMAAFYRLTKSWVLCLFTESQNKCSWLSLFQACLKLLVFFNLDLSVLWQFWLHSVKILEEPYSYQSCCHFSGQFEYVKVLCCRFYNFMTPFLGWFSTIWGIIIWH